jgi:hypothetical protein
MSAATDKEGNMFTYEDFIKKANETGLLGEFSTYDLAVAQENPDFGFSILTLKQDYRNAPTPEAKALINAKANELRRHYGYTGGESGSGFYTEGFSYPGYENRYTRTTTDMLDKVLNPREFSYPDYQSRYTQTATDMLGRLLNRQDFSYPEYQSRYTETATRLLDELLNRPEFSYDLQSDPSYSAYRKQYLREGKRASEDVLGQAAAMTGGMPSSAAVTAASQAGDYYASQLSDMIPTLYLKEFTMDRAKLDTVRDMESTDYSRWASDRDFSYQDYLNRYSMDKTGLDIVRDMESTDYARWAGERDFSYQDYLNRYNMGKAGLDIMRDMESTDYARWADERDFRFQDYLTRQSLARADEQTRTAQDQQRISNALDIWRAYGYATQEVADALGVPVGTPTSDQRYSDWSMRMREAGKR